MLNLMGHWYFATQYLKTCLTLPRLLTEAKLEWVLEDSEEIVKNNPASCQLDKNRLRDALAESKVDISMIGDSLIETITKIDEVINASHAYVKQVTRGIFWVNVIVTAISVTFLGL